PDESRDACYPGVCADGGATRAARTWAETLRLGLPRPLSEWRTSTCKREQPLSEPDKQHGEASQVGWQLGGVAERHPKRNRQVRGRYHRSFRHLREALFLRAHAGPPVATQHLQRRARATTALTRAHL